MVHFRNYQKVYIIIHQNNRLDLMNNNYIKKLVVMYLYIYLWINFHFLIFMLLKIIRILICFIKRIKLIL